MLSLARLCSHAGRGHMCGLCGILVLLNIPHPEASSSCSVRGRVCHAKRTAGAGNGLVLATGWCWQLAGAGNGLVVLGDELVMPGNVLGMPGDCVE